MKKVKLGEICEIQAGGTPSRNKKEFWVQGNIPWVKIKDINSKHISKVEEHITELGLQFSSAKLFSRGTILYTIFATIGEVAILDIDAATNQAIAGLHLKSEKVLKDYLYFFLLSIKNRVKNDSRGVAQNNINLTYLKNIEVPIVENIIQQEICNNLTKINQIITQRNQQLVELSNLVKSRFNEMFGDPVLNEMGWEKHRLSKLTLKIGSGATPRGGRESYVNEGIALIRSMNVYDGKFMFKDLAYLTNIQAEKLNNVIVESDDVLLNITGASVSRCCIVPQNILPARVNQHVSIIRCKKHLLSPIFLNQLLITSEFKSLLLKIGESSGATRQAITKNQIEELYVPLPPLSLQNEFADFVAQVDKSQFACGIVIKLWRNSLKSSII
ncbi:restriction endonuclease subunit S [Streptococcus oralis]|uniref:restriction endonuclease subunit S n=3 Tax=Streptococcus TaxID=1301 RepID=UPI001CC048F7|nr:restriction endonuclease subunit S [Streptococcus oralis]MBZ2083333.1 restriction endonuclease subunit S [Streptococcus oralis]